MLIVTDRPDRRTVILGLGFGLVGCASEPLRGSPDLVVPYDPRRTDAPRLELPVLALYERRGHTLGWVAGLRVLSPREPTAALVRDAFARVEPGAVVLEGFPTVLGPNPPSVIEQALATPADQGDEIVVAIREAVARGCEVWGGEPTEQERTAFLIAQGFDRVDVYFASYLGPLEQERRRGAFRSPADPRFDEAYRRWEATTAPAHGYLASASADGFRWWFRDRFGTRIEDDPEWFARGWPGREGVGSAIARASQYARDRHAFSAVMERLGAHERVVVVFSGSRFPSIRPALDAAFGAPELLRPQDVSA